MNGRVYDPKLGRFLQADPFVQAPKNSQSLNRYSYVLNNPLSYTDPSGFFFKELFNFARAFVRVITSDEFDFRAWVDLIRSGVDLFNSLNSQQDIVLPGVMLGAFTNGFATPVSNGVSGVQNGAAQTATGFSRGVAGSGFAKVRAIADVFMQGNGYDSPNKAVEAGFNSINPISQLENSEYGFAVYSLFVNGETRYYYSLFVTDNLPSTISNLLLRTSRLIPSNAALIGIAHTHPLGSNSLGDSYPSGADQNAVTSSSAGKILGRSAAASRPGLSGIEGWVAGADGSVHQILPSGDITPWTTKVNY